MTISIFLFEISALESNGIVYSWGYNNLGQLGWFSSYIFSTISTLIIFFFFFMKKGDGTYLQKLTPEKVIQQEGVMAGRKIVSIAVGGGNSVAADSDGRVYTWG